MLFCFCPQIVQVDVAVLITGDYHHLHSCHMCRSRVSAVSRGRNQADIAMTFVAAFVIVTNRQQPRVFPLCAGVRLHTDGVVPGEFHQPVRKLANHLMISFGLFRRAERMQFSEFRPGDRNHLGGGVQLHGAGTQRDHRLVQRQIFTLQRVRIAHHLGFAVVTVKYRMRQNRIVTQHTLLNGTAIKRHVFIQCFNVQTVAVAQQNIEQLRHILTGGGFIERNTHRVMNIAAQIDLCRFRTRQYRSFISHFHTQGVEVVRMTQL